MLVLSFLISQSHYEGIFRRGTHLLAISSSRRKKTKEGRLANGWSTLGDIGKVDEDGFLFLDGRQGNMIVLYGGEKLHPEHVEEDHRHRLGDDEEKHAPVTEVLDEIGGGGHEVEGPGLLPHSIRFMMANKKDGHKYFYNNFNTFSYA